ncbi:MAG: hypothetical protein HY776_06920 [Actinobacteria bacterium]|nr:hypothetical protein [Actinomycetota bacterium]
MKVAPRKTRLAKEEISWGKRLEDITSRIREKTAKYPARELEKDISEALKEVKNRKSIL